MPPKKKAANGYKLVEPIPKGTILVELSGKSWRLGPSIGKIYSAQEESAKGDKYPYVVKIEPHSNGALFVETDFYIRNAKPVDVENFKKKNGLKTFGMPVYYGFGSHEYNKEKYRFLVMDQFSIDLYKLYIDNNKVFPVDTVFKIGLQLIDVLEYIHNCGYVHADIKAENVLLGATKETLNKQVYLVDFGLATKFSMEKEFKPNPKKAHDGTIEFLSRDAHQGVQTRRGDLEILAYNLIQWLGCKLPWESNLSDPKIVQKSKEENMSTVPKIIKACFGTNSYPKAIVDYLNYLHSLNFNTEPDYKKIRTIFTAGVKEGGGSIGTQLQFSPSKTVPKRSRTPITENVTAKSKKVKTTETEGDVSPKPKRKGRKQDKAEPDEMATPNGIPVKEKKDIKKAATKRGLNKRLSKSLDNIASSDPLEGYTAAMKEIALKKMNKANGPKKRGRPQKTPPDVIQEDEAMAGYNDEMKELALKKKKPKSGQTASNGLAVATTSKATSKQGIVKTRTVRKKAPKSYQEDAEYSDGAASV